MNEAQRRRQLDEFTVWFITHPGPRGQAAPVFNSAAAGCPHFTVITPGAYAYTFGRRDEMLRVADLLGAFTAGDVGRAAVLMGTPPPEMS